MKKALELYIHIPFCIRKCEYCDFLSGPANLKRQKEYVDALRKEIQAAGQILQERQTEYEVVSVFFGGGTPSVMEADEIQKIMKLLQEQFDFTADAEVTIEANPGTVTEEKLKCYKESGINRISFGCQSVNDTELKELGRIHTYEEFLESYQMARRADFQNINVDLMSGLPNQTLASWEHSLRTIANLKPEHISAYSLIIEEGTPFYERELTLPGEDEERQMYTRTAEILREYGFEQYEISNYALSGKACRHNCGYWERTDYLGMGLGASSLMENVRFANTDDMEEYLANSSTPEKIRENKEVLSKHDQMEEFMFLGLRMTEGVSVEQFQENFGESIREVYGEILEKYEKLGLLIEEDGRIFLSRKGISVSNQIMAEFLF